MVIRLSIYRDVLFLAGELKARFGSGVWTASPRELDEEVKRDKEGIVVPADSFPLSRYQEWRQARADKVSMFREERADAEESLTDERPPSRLRDAIRLRPIKVSNPKSMPEERRPVSDAPREQSRRSGDDVQEG